MIRPASLLAVVTLAGAPAAASSLEAIAAALSGGTAPEGLAARADCEAPDGETFETEVVTLADGTTRFEQRFAARTTALLRRGDAVSGRSAGDGRWVDAPPPLAAFVRGHELHAMLLKLDRRFTLDPSGDARAGCLALRDADDAPATLCVDGASGLPSTLRISTAAAGGDEPVELRYGDWRERLGLRLPYAVAIVQGDERFEYAFTAVLPFRVAPGTTLPEDPASRFERLGDLAEIAALHERGLAAHRERDVRALVADAAPRGVISGRGRLGETTPEATRERLGPYLERTRFERYEDVAVPVVAVSADGTLGWLACEIEAAGTQRDEAGEAHAIAFGFSWVELLARDDDGRWLRVGNASSGR